MASPNRLSPSDHPPHWAAHVRILLDAYRHWLGRDLIDRDGSFEAQASRLFHAPQVVVSHGAQSDPILSYGNRAALELWEIDIPTLLATPSRLTAEPMHRDERAQLLERTRRDGYADDYSGIRVTTTGRRFRIEQAVIWNLRGPTGDHVGQAATFSRWFWL